MATLKLFRNLLIAFISLWIFVTVVSNVMIKTSYRYIDDYQTYSEEGIIKIENSRATKVNGYIEGTFTNTTGNNIEKLFVVVQCFSENDVLLGTEYEELTNIAPNEERKFRIEYQYDDVEYLKIITTKIEPNSKDFNFNFDNMFNINVIDNKDLLTKLAIFAGILVSIRLLPRIFPF